MGIVKVWQVLWPGLKGSVWHKGVGNGQVKLQWHRLLFLPPMVPPTNERDGNKQ